MGQITLILCLECLEFFRHLPLFVSAIIILFDIWA
jgi:hypothetical protein